MRQTRLKAIIIPMLEIVAAVGIAGVVWYGGYSVTSGGRTQGAFLAFLRLLAFADDFRLRRRNGSLCGGHFGST